MPEDNKEYYKTPVLVVFEPRNLDPPEEDDKRYPLYLGFW